MLKVTLAAAVVILAYTLLTMRITISNPQPVASAEMGRSMDTFQQHQNGADAMMNGAVVGLRH
jgi:hypothetical protein